MMRNTFKLILSIAIIFTITACYEAKMQQEGQQAVNAFLEKMSPELARKIADIEAEIALTKEKINKLSELKLKHPNYVGKIESSRKQWEVLQDKLQHSLKEIRDVVESTYVTYELDRIQGGNQFNKISDDLLSSANSVLATAGITKNAIEQALVEVDEESVFTSENDVIDNTIIEDNSITENIEDNSTTENNVVTEPIVEPDNSIKPINYCSLKTALADVHLNLMMLVITTDKSEQNTLKIELKKANHRFETILVDMADNNHKAILQKNWQLFKNTSLTEIIPTVQSGNNDKALHIANEVQVGRMNTMNTIVQNLTDDDCE